jgi:hypothetical protein
VLAVGGDTGFYLSSAEVYDPATNRWSPAGDLTTARWEHLSVVLPDGRLMVIGGSNGALLASTEVFAEQGGVSPAARPTVVLPGSANAGSTVVLTGTGLSAGSEGSGGSTASSPGAALLLLRRVGGGAAVSVAVRASSPTMATATLPSSLLPGWHEARVMVNGAASASRVIIIGARAPAGLGAPCLAGTDCASTWCASGVCCESACAGTCETCANDAGTCTRSSAGTPCRAASCSAAMATLAASCDGVLTSCPSAQTLSCGALGCAGTGCAVSCASDVDCGPGGVCVMSVCSLAQDAGTQPGDAGCIGGGCADGGTEPGDGGCTGSGCGPPARLQVGCGCSASSEEAGVVALLGLLALRLRRRGR